MNAFEQLRSDDSVPAGADPRFASRLRSEIEAAFTPEIELPERKARMTMTDQMAPDPQPAHQIVTPYLAVDDASAALDWYRDALGAVELTRFTGDDGRVGHAEISVHGARIYLADAYPEIGVVAASSHEGTSVSLHLEVDDVDAVHARAVEHGAISGREPSDQPHGARSATISDPSGHRWMLSQQIATPSIDEIDAATPGFSVTGAPPDTIPQPPIQLGYYTIHTDDIGLAAAFYSALLGWDVDPESGHVDNCDLPFGFESRHFEDGYHLWMTVRDPEPVLARILELGGEIVGDSESRSGRSIECRDDQGNRFDLHAPAPGYG